LDIQDLINKLDIQDLVDSRETKDSMNPVVTVTKALNTKSEALCQSSDSELIKSIKTYNYM